MKEGRKSNIDRPYNILINIVDFEDQANLAGVLDVHCRQAGGHMDPQSVYDLCKDHVLATEKKISVDGQQGLQAELKRAYFRTQVVVLIPLPGEKELVVLQFEETTSDVDDEMSEESIVIIDQVLSTFRFFANDQMYPWEIFAHPELGYQFQYPLPADGIAKIENTGFQTQIYKNTPNGPITHPYGSYLNVLLIQNVTNTSGVEWINNSSNISKILEHSSSWQNTEWEEQDNWFISTDTISTDGAEWYAFGFFEDQVVQISFSEDRETLKQVLSTFEFLE